MELELWLFAIHTALEDGVRHIKWLHIQAPSYDYIINLKDTTTGEDSLLLYKVSSPVKSVSMKNTLIAIDDSEKARLEPPSSMYG